MMDVLGFGHIVRFRHSVVSFKCTNRRLGNHDTTQQLKLD